MHNASTEIMAFMESLLGADFHLEIISFKTKTYDPYEKKTKNRFELRNLLYQFLKEKKGFVFEDVLDLRNVPQKIGNEERNYYCSLSHTEDVGVFVIDSQPIGVDFENRTRIKQEVVARICHKQEMALNPDFQIVWSMKESAFKSIPFLIQPKKVSDIIIEKIEQDTSSRLANYKILKFSASVKKSSKISIYGMTISNSETQLAIAKTKIE